MRRGRHLASQDHRAIMKEPNHIAVETVKAYLDQLVDVCGKSTAVGAYLGISPQRVRQLCSLTCPDLPTMMQIIRLEAWARQPIVTSALAKAAVGALEGGDLGKETREATYAVVDLQRAAESGADKESLLACVLKAKRAVDDVEAVLISEGA